MSKLTEHADIGLILKFIDKIGLIEPDALDRSAIVGNVRVNHFRSPAAVSRFSVQHLAFDPCDFADGKFVDGEGISAFIAEGCMFQDITNRFKSKPRQKGRALWSDSF